MRLVEHPNVVKMHAFFYSSGEKVCPCVLLRCELKLMPLPRQKDEVFLNLVLEFVPETIYRGYRSFIKHRDTKNRSTKGRTGMPAILVKLYTYQLLRSLNYIHGGGICHRDIKPQNLLLAPATGTLKLCDFGSAKILIATEPNVSYICSRYYRAPELIFGATNYTTKIGAKLFL